LQQLNHIFIYNSNQCERSYQIMADKTYDIVSEADTVIVLRNPLVEFAVWDKPNDISSAPDDCKASAASDNDMTPRTVEDTKDTTQPSIISKNTSPTDETSESRVAEDYGKPKTGKPQPKESVSTKIPVGGIHYLVSSAHLKVASKTWRKALSGNWAETIRKDDGRCYLTVHDWDETALLTLLNIIHLRNRQVVRETDLDLLTKIAILVDYYNCDEAIEMYSAAWVETVRRKSPVPSTYCRPLILWLCVSSIFRVADIFESATNVAIHWATNATLRTLDLPIAATVVGRLTTTGTLNDALINISPDRQKTS
jgi:hypothetical protein